MRTNRLLTVAFALAMVCLAGCAVAAPDVFNHALKSVFTPEAGALLAFGPLVRNLQAAHATEIQAMRGLFDKATAEKRDMTAEEQVTFDQHKARAESLKAQIERAKELELAEAGLGQEAATAAATQMTANVLQQRGEGSVTVRSAASMSVSENVETDPQRGFVNFGDFARAVRGAAMAGRTGIAMDQRLVPLAAAPSTFAGEGNGADGGLLVPPGFSNNIFQLSLAEDALLPLTDDINVEGNGMSFPRDETTPWGTDGVRAYWQGEATAGTPTKPVLGADQLRLKKLMALVPVTDELLADSTALTGYLPSKVADSMRWKTNESILFGSGVGVPLGALAGAAAIVVSKDSGQATGTLSVTNCANMIARLPPGSYPRAVWIINNDVLPALFTLTLGNYPVYLPGGINVGGVQVNPYGMLLGRPIIVSQHAKSFSSQGDVTLVDLKYYQAITKAEGMVTATSMHLYFDADAMAFRTTFRMDGAPKISKAIQPANGSNTLSPFVQLQAR